MNAARIETGLVVAVPELDEQVGSWRRKVGEVADIPAHVTLMYPFAYPIDFEALDAFFAGQAAFDFALTSVGWFGEEFVYLAVDPLEPFRDLTGRIQVRWPEYRPYGGEFADPTPHLTIAAQGDLDLMRRVADDAAGLLPIACRADRVLLMKGTSDPSEWSVAASFRLNG